VFEVTKADEELSQGSSPPPSSSPGAGPMLPKPQSTLKVIIPSELQGVSYIEVTCRKGNISNKNFMFSPEYTPI